MNLNFIEQIRKEYRGSEWPQFLSAVTIKGLRGWTGQRVPFDYPVTAVVGENGLAPNPATGGHHAASSGGLSLRRRTLGRAGIGASVSRCAKRSSCLRPLKRSAAVVPSARFSA